MIVVWRVTQRCNLACAFCAYDKRLPGVRREVDVARVVRFARVLAAWREASGERVLLSWLGGEPLLWNPLFDVSRGLVESGIDIGATTNGTTLLQPRVREDVRASFAELTVSVDGPAAFHERMRGWPGGWTRLRAAVRALRAERSGGKPLLRANVVLMHDNLPLFAALCDELAEWGFDEISFNQLGGRDRPEFFAAHRLLPADASALAELMPALRERLAARGVRLCGAPAYLRRIEASTRDEHLAVEECTPPERFLFIDESGSASPCSFTGDELGVPIESLDSVQALQQLPARFALQRRRTRPPACEDCPSTQLFAKFAG